MWIGSNRKAKLLEILMKPFMFLGRNSDNFVILNKLVFHFIYYLSQTNISIDLHPEKRMRSAYIDFEEENMPRLKKENPNMRLSQLKQMLNKEWMKSPKIPQHSTFATWTRISSRSFGNRRKRRLRRASSSTWYRSTANRNANLKSENLANLKMKMIRNLQLNKGCGWKWVTRSNKAISIWQRRRNRK